MSNKLFSEVLNGKKSEEQLKGLDVDTLKGLKNSAASIISRANDLEKRDRAIYLRSLIQQELDLLTPKKVQAEWKVKEVDALELADVNKAIKQAQWYKHTYGPAAKAKWSKILNEVSKEDPLYTKARNFLDKCDDLYEKALNDEDHWLNIKDTHFAEATSKNKPSKVDALNEVLVELEGQKLNKQALSILEKLKAAMSK